VSTLLFTVLVTACGRAEMPPTSATPAASIESTSRPGAEATNSVTLDAAEALCRPSGLGYLRARLQGAVEADIDWSLPTTPQCLGGPRPAQDGLRLVYKGTAGADRLLVIIGIAVGETVTAGRNVPASVTVVREGAGEFFATQGDDKCAIDELAQEPVAGQDGRYRLSGRGFCTQPARAVGAASGSVLVSRFDVDAVVEYSR
jgi:hypothetical protein